MITNLIEKSELSRLLLANMHPVSSKKDCMSPFMPKEHKHKKLSVLYSPLYGYGEFNIGKNFAISSELNTALAIFEELKVPEYSLNRNIDDLKTSLIKTAPNKYERRLIFAHSTINDTDTENLLSTSLDNFTYLFLFSKHEDMLKPLGKYHPEQHGFHRVTRYEENPQNILELVKKFIHQQ